MKRLRFVMALFSMTVPALDLRVNQSTLHDRIARLSSLMSAKALRKSVTLYASRTLIAYFAVHTCIAAPVFPSSTGREELGRRIRAVTS